MSLLTFAAERLDPILGFFQTPAGRAITEQALAAERAKRLSDRQQWRERYDRAGAAALRATLAFQKDEPRLLADVEARKAALDEALARLDARRRQKVDALWPLDRERDQMESLLRGSVSPLFADFRTRITELIASVYKHESDSVCERCVDGNMRVTWSNRDSVHAKVAAIEAAGHAAGDLALEPLDDAELAARLDALLERLPTVEQRPAQFLRGA